MPATHPTPEPPASFGDDGFEDTIVFCDMNMRCRLGVDHDGPCEDLWENDRPTEFDRDCP